MKLKDFKLLNEGWNNWVNEESSDEERDNLIDMIRDYSKELTGRRDIYGDYDKLATMSTEELKDYYQGMFDSPEAQSAEDDARERADAELGKDDEFDMMPTQSGMGRRMEEAAAPYQVGDYVRIVSGGLRGAAGKVIELTTLITDEPGLVVLLDTDADKRVFGQAGDEVVVGMDKVQPPVGQMREAIRKMVVNKLQEKAKSKNQQQFMGMVKKCQDTGDCASAEVKKAADSMKKSDVKDFAGTKHKGLPDKVEEGREISYSDVRQEYDAILDFLKKDILQKQGSKYVADALELLANDVRDSLHNPDPFDKENWAYFDRDSGTQPNLKEDDLDERCQKGYKTHPTQKTKEMYGKTYRNCVKAEEGVEVKDKFDDEVEKRNKKSMKQGLAYLKKEGNLGSFVDSILDEIMDEDLEEAAKCTGPTKKASSDAKGKKWMKCVKSDSGGYKRIHWGQKGVRVTGKSGDTKRKKSFKARHNCSKAKSNTPQGQACKDWAE